MLYFQYKILPDEVLEYLSLGEQFSILPDKAYSYTNFQVNISKDWREKSGKLNFYEEQ